MTDVENLCSKTVTFVGHPIWRIIGSVALDLHLTLYAIGLLHHTCRIVVMEFEFCIETD